MAVADFGIKTQLLTDDQIKTVIQDLIESINQLSTEGAEPFEINLEDPGIAAFIATMIRSIEKALLTSFEPLVALFNVILDSLKAGLKAIPVFFDKIVKVVTGLKDLLLPDPITGIINFIVGKIIQPIIDNINIPFPSIPTMIELIFNSITLSKSEYEKWITNIDFNKWLESGKILISTKLQGGGKKTKEAVERGLTLFQKVEGFEKPAFLKLLEVLLMPIKFCFELIKKIIDLVTGLVTNLFDAISNMLKILSNPVQFVLDLIAGIFSDVLSAILNVLFEFEDKEKIEKTFNTYILNLFNLTAPKIDIKEWIKTLPPEIAAVFNSISGFINFISSFLTWFIGLISKPAALLAGLFGLMSSNMSPVKMKYTVYSSKTNTLIADSSEGLGKDDLSKILQPKSKIIFYDSKRNPIEAEVVSVKEFAIILKTKVSNSDVLKGEFEIIV